MRIQYPRLWIFLLPITAALFQAMAAGATSTENLLVASETFADSLFADRDYYRAITEYKRVLYLTSPDDLAIRARVSLRIGEALFKGEQFQRAATWLARQQQLLARSPYEVDRRRLLLRSLLAGGDMELFVATADAMEDENAMFYSGVALGMQRRWDNAATTFTLLPPASPYFARAQYNLEVADQAKLQHWKSPTLAGILGVVPGLGYLYAGHEKTALSALLMNTVFLIGTYQAFQHDQTALGTFMAVFSVTWYGGSIFGSAQAAQRHNWKINQGYVDHMIQ